MPIGLLFADVQSVLISEAKVLKFPTLLSKWANTITDQCRSHTPVAKPWSIIVVSNINRPLAFDCILTDCKDSFQTDTMQLLLV